MLSEITSDSSTSPETSYSDDSTLSEIEYVLVDSESVSSISSDSVTSSSKLSISVISSSLEVLS